MAGNRSIRRARRLAHLLRTGAEHALGEARQWRRGVPRGPECVLLVLGCQRSGTTLMTHLLAQDPGAKIYPEHSMLSAGDRNEGLRLAPLPLVARAIEASRFPLVVLKPLVESQHADRLLDRLPGARGLWMFRHWADVARSNLALFGETNGIKNLRGVVARASGDWRGERVSEEVLEVVRSSFSEDMNPRDAAALFWWVRNALFFDLALDSHPRVATCRYEELVADPGQVLSGIYDTMGRAVPALEGGIEVSTASVGRGDPESVSPAVARLCNSMWERLRCAHEGAAACA
jgi:hypothetical protein